MNINHSLDEIFKEICNFRGYVFFGVFWGKFKSIQLPGFFFKKKVVYSNYVIKYK